MDLIINNSQHLSTTSENHKRTRNNTENTDYDEFIQSKNAQN